MEIEKGKVKQLTPLQRHQRKFSASLSLQKAVWPGLAWPQGLIPVQLIGNIKLHSLIAWQSLFLPPSQDPCLLEAKHLPRTVPSKPCPCLSKDRPGLTFCLLPLGFAINHPWVFWGVILPPGAVPEVHLKKICFSWQSSYLQSPLGFWLRLIHLRRSLK